MLNEMTMTKAMENNLVEVYNVKAHLSATSDKELEESLQLFVQNRAEYCDILSRRINKLNDTVAKVLGDSAELAGPAAKVIEEFRDDMTDLLNDLHNVTAEEEYREFGTGHVTPKSRCMRRSYILLHKRKKKKERESFKLSRPLG